MINIGLNNGLGTIVLGLIMATFDLFAMSFMKTTADITQAFSIGRWIRLLIFPILVYAAQPILFFLGLHNGASMTVLNLTWDIMSDLLVTAAGVLWFKESLSTFKLWGVVFGLTAVLLFVLDGGNLATPPQPP